MSTGSVGPPSPQNSSLKASSSESRTLSFRGRQISRSHLLLRALQPCSSAIALSCRRGMTPSLISSTGCHNRLIRQFRDWLFSPLLATRSRSRVYSGALRFGSSAFPSHLREYVIHSVLQLGRRLVPGLSHWHTPSPLFMASFAPAPSLKPSGATLLDQHRMSLFCPRSCRLAANTVVVAATKMETAENRKWKWKCRHPGNRSHVTTEANNVTRNQSV